MNGVLIILKKFKGYGKDNWGLTASYSVKGYAAHAPDSVNDLGVILQQRHYLLFLTRRSNPWLPCAIGIAIQC
jgi:nuclear transport factor 2 (NTF2) superfamily protein